MKKICFFLLCVSVTAIISPLNAFAQKQTFDISTYTPPPGGGWKKQTAESAVQFTIEDAAKGTYCLITLYKSVPGTANAKENFDLAWASLVKEMVTVSTDPEMQAPSTEDGWEVQSGYAPFENDGNKGVVILITSSGFEKMVNIIVLTNTDVYEKEMTGFLESLSLKKPEANTPQIQTPAVNYSDSPFPGTWGKSGSVNPAYNDAYATSIAGYSKDQYTFNSNGTYHFVSKTFGMSFAKLLLVKENGTYQITGNTITINPQKSVIEAWSKKDGVDKWGKLLSSQKRTLEKITYQFTKHYFSGIQLWNFVLQADKQTQRDGPFSSNTTFNNAWYYSPISGNNPEIELPGGQQLAAEEIKKAPVQQKASDNNATIIGTWGKGNSATQAGGSFGRWSYTKEQYIFNERGTYSFARKVYVENNKETLLTKETGTYTTNGNKIIINPKTNVIEAWSKLNGGDNFKQLISSQKQPLEKSTYQFTVQYNMELKDTFFVIIADKETARDGLINANSVSPIAWRYGSTPPFIPITMPN